MIHWTIWLEKGVQDLLFFLCKRNTTACLGSNLHYFQDVFKQTEVVVITKKYAFYFRAQEYFKFELSEAKSSFLSCNLLFYVQKAQHFLDIAYNHIIHSTCSGCRWSPMITLLLRTLDLIPSSQWKSSFTDTSTPALLTGCWWVWILFEVLFQYEEIIILQRI